MEKLKTSRPDYMDVITNELLSLRGMSFGVAAFVMASLILGSVGMLAQFARPQTAHAAADPAPVCSVIELHSSASTMTAGWTHTNPTAAPLNQALYSLGSYGSAQSTETVIPPWVDPATAAHLSGSGAQWVSTGASWPGGVSNTEGVSTENQWRLFKDSFTLPVGSTVTSANLWYTADNAAAVYLNGNTTPIATTNGATEDVFGTTPGSLPSNFGTVYSQAFSPVVGENTLNFVTRNWSADSVTNPTGLVYHATVNYCMPTQPNVTVTINKFVQGVMATALNSDNADFPMTAEWDAANIGAGEGSYALSETNQTAYQAKTTEMSLGADYSTKEMVNGDVVGAQCATGKPFALVGYTTGNTLAEAMAATPSMAKPEFENLQMSKQVIVWNRDCSLPEGQIGGDVTDGALQVTGVDMIDTTATANGTFADGWKYVFHITAPSTEQNLAMKFSDWLRTGGSGTILVANNMRISSAQANNGGATILLTAANLYSTPALHMTSDLDPVMAGRQVEITVDVAVPNGTPVGSYTTNYGVQSGL